MLVLQENLGLDGCLSVLVILFTLLPPVLNITVISLSRESKILILFSSQMVSVLKLVLF